MWCCVEGVIGGEPEGVGLYEEEIKPVLKERCYACHGALKQKGGLRLDTVEFIRAGSKNGSVIEDGGEGIEILRRVRSQDLDERMPPEGEALSSDWISRMAMWLEGGATGPVGELPEADPNEHWAFRPVGDGVDLDLDGALSGGRNPIDIILSGRHEKAGLVPYGEEDERRLVRRAFLDLIGLPPRIEDYRDYFRGEREVRWERLIERLLSMPQHGERWARHWMDVWRYSDWYGLGDQLRYSQKHIWHWRDWIIESLNEDVGYDEMLIQMLAADEVYPEELSRLRATGFLARNYYLFNRTTWLDSTIEHVSKGILGLTYNCAKCHDHKYDPISQENYYQMRAIFEPHQVRLDPVPGERNLEINGVPRVFDAHPGAVTNLHIRGDEKNPNETMKIVPGMLSVVKPGGALEVNEIALSRWAYQPSVRDYVISDLKSSIEQQLVSANAQKNALGESEDEVHLAEALEARIDFLESDMEFVKLRHEFESGNKISDEDKDEDEALEIKVRRAYYHRSIRELEYEILDIRNRVAGTEEGKQDEKKRLQKLMSDKESALEELQSGGGGNGMDFPGLRVSRKALESPAETEDSRYAPYPEVSTGRRAAFAAWVVDPANPLTARVVVNHVWMRHFGEPLVENVADFGRRQPEPVLRELLDYLAKDFVEHGWHFKRLHRIIVDSDAWKRRVIQGGEFHAEANRSADPENRLYWKRSAVRMESQAIRDAILYLAGELDMTIGGPSVGANPKKGPFRRSLYFLHSRDSQNQFLGQFDDADIMACYRRETSILPQQALALTHSRLALEMVPLIANRVRNECLHGGADLSEFARVSFQILLGRDPDEEEVSACLEVMNQLAGERKYPLLIHSLINHNEFISIQ